MSEEESLKIIDTSEGLTKEELIELKRLAAMSKASRAVIAFVIGGIMLFGVDKVMNVIQNIGHR